ncbi:MAG: hypothetical protein KF819_07985 [Labilithrix sp.]|nr:hypothetical protein [Labilithrix sp.]
MGARATTAALAIASALGVGLLGEACRTPTQVTLDVTYEGTCADLGGVGLIVGTDPYAAEDRIKHDIFTTVTTECTEGKPARVGTLVVTPNDDTDRASIIVLAGFGKRPEACKAADGYRGCIIARRSLSFVERTRLTLAIGLDPNCLDFPCDALSTCKNQKCVESRVDCSSEGCGEVGVLPDGGEALTDAPTNPDAYVNQDGPVEPPIDGAPPPDANDDANVDAGFCEEPDEPLPCDTPAGRVTCAPGQACCEGYGVVGDGGPTLQPFACRTPNNCYPGTSRPMHCRSARQCPAGQICCQTNPSAQASLECRTSCPVYGGGPDGGGSTMAQFCQSACECRGTNASCSPVMLTGSPPQMGVMQCTP